MASELRVTLRGPAGAMDAGRVWTDVGRMLRVLGDLEDAALRRDSGPAQRSVWAFAHLAVASIDMGLAPLEPRQGASWDDLDRVALRTVEGFAEAERHDVLPAEWSEDAAREARKLARGLGTTADRGMRLRLLVDGVVQREVEVTRRAGRNLNVALQSRRESIGSAIGVLGSINVHRRNSAGLWLDRGRRRVTVVFNDDQTRELTNVLGQRVAVAGRLQRNAAGQLLRIYLRGVEVLQSVDDALPLSGLTGLAPNLTDGKSTVEYLREMRGAS